MVVNTFRYAGNKQWLVPIINYLLHDIDTENYIYIEPFLGSGAIFYNLDKGFQKYYLNDIDKNIIKLHNCFIKYSYNDYLYLLDEVKNNYGDIKEDKKAYYNFRDAYNKNAFGYKNDLALLMLANSCINSMLRFGPNGMNQSFGHRHYFILEKNFNHCKNRLYQSTILSNKDYSEIFKELSSNENYILFVDPPYIEREMPFTSKFDKNTFIENLINLVKTLNIKIVYTDMENNYYNNLLLDNGFNIINGRTILNISPSKHCNKIGQEVIYVYGLDLVKEEL